MIVIAAALLLAIQVVRNAAVQALVASDPVAAARLWPGHPAVEISLGLTEIGRAARERKPVDRGIFTMINGAAVKEPLATEPFLVRGVQAQVAHNSEAAKDAFLAAQWRDPRSLPAAYFLAEYYLRVHMNFKALEETALLARLSPSGIDAVAPFVATYARNPSNWRQMRALFRSQQGLEDRVLIALARDPQNAGVILALADPEYRKPSSNWLPILLRGLVEGGQYSRARAIWSSVGGAQAGNALLYDADFSSPAPPPPFNWTLVSSTVGMAERQSGRRLHLIFYGGEDGVLASQLVILPPGAYRLQMAIIGSPVHPEELSWSIRCAASNQPLGSLGIEQAARGWTFQVPASCPAQWLELSGRSSDIPQQTDVTIGPITLMRTGTNG